MSTRAFRIAPSPTGFFHVGGARTALFNWALARRLGGRFVLRIEDTDEARDRPEWTQGIIDALAWLGISADDPTFEGPYFQSANADAHVAAAERLFADGSRLLLRPDRRADPGPGEGSRAARLRRVLARPRARTGSRAGAALPRARGHARSSATSSAVTSRSTTRRIEDFVLLRGNGRPLFVLANVVDDIDMGITHVVRGDEHLPNTPKQQLLWEALGHEPPVWAHVPVLVNEARQKLSKRRDKVALEQYRDEGYLADAMVNYLMTLGWAPKGDTEIVPWAAHRGRVPARGRHPLAGVLRRAQADRVQQGVPQGALARRLRRRVRAVAARALRPGDVRAPSPRCCRPGSTRSPRPRPRSTSCSSTAADRRGVVAEGDGATSGPASSSIGSSTATGRSTWDAEALKAEWRRIVDAFGVKPQARRRAGPGRDHGPLGRAAAVRVARAARTRARACAGCEAARKRLAG